MTSPPETNGDTRIRAEVTWRKSLSSGDNPTYNYPQDAPAPDRIKLHLQPPTKFPTQLAFEVKPNGRYALGDLLQYHDENFVRIAYQALLRRAPDEGGLKAYLALLRNGAAKVDILGWLSDSPEGRSNGVHVDGLPLALLVRKIGRWPAVGHLVQIVAALWNLPTLERNQRVLENRVIQLTEISQANIQESLPVFHGALQSLERGYNQLVTFTASKPGHNALSELRSSLNDVKSSIEWMRVSADSTKTDYTALEAAQTRYSAELEKVNQSVLALSQSKASTSSLDEARLSLIKSIESKAERSEISSLSNQLLQVVERSISSLQGTIATVDQAKADRVSLDSMRANTDALAAQASNFKRNLLDQERRLGYLLTEARKRLPEPISTPQIESMLKEQAHVLDSMYASFEDRFRGTRADIRQRQTIYIPLVRQAQAGSSDSPVVDLGCGRGEWLELLRDEGLIARGVDLNRVFLASCREMALDVTEQDAVAFLSNIKSDSVGAVTAFHLVEHLPHKILIALFDEALRVLKPSGIVIFETPNPENLLVGACNFYTDFTHINPLPPEPLRFLLEARGFVTTEIKRVHPFGHFKDLEVMAPELARFFTGAQDYALIGYKA
jgi:SAM-dependent methyltransferase